MTARPGVGIATSAMTMTVAAAATMVTPANADAVARERPRGATENCSTSHGWPVGSAREFTEPWNLVVGPIALEGAGVTFQYAETEGEVYNKLLVHVRGGRRVTLELPRRSRPDVGFGFGRTLPATGRSSWDLRITHRVVTFSACPLSKRSGVADEWPVTGWVGWLLARSPRCVPLRIWVDDEPSPREAVIRFGVRHCE